MIRQVLAIGALVAVVITLTVYAAARVGARFDREQPPMPASPSPILGAPSGAAGLPVIAGPDPLLTDADFEGAYAYLSEQRREGSR